MGPQHGMHPAAAQHRQMAAQQAALMHRGQIGQRPTLQVTIEKKQKPADSQSLYRGACVCVYLYVLACLDGRPSCKLLRLFFLVA